MRKESKDSSEMISQVLYGEAVELLKESGDWFYARALRDNYEGWLDKHQFRVSNDAEEKIARHIVCSKQVVVQADEKEIVMPLGAKLELQGDMVVLGDSVHPYYGELTTVLEPTSIALNKLCTAWEGTSYLWGGRSTFGADCSGFTQSIFECFGLSIKRDSSQQIESGEQVKFSDSRVGDLAFFSKDGEKIYHVGIILAENSIAHCSAFYRVDEFRREGIYRKSEKRISHKLHSIRRLIDFI